MTLRLLCKYLNKSLDLTKTNKLEIIAPGPL